MQVKQQARPRAKSAPSSDDLGQYARDLARWPTWTPADELAHGARLAAARKANDAIAIRRVSQAFVRHNLRLVLLVAHRFKGYGVPILDLVQDGNLGLMRAVESFDPERGTRFCTYASWWITHNIRRSLDDTSQTVRVPVHTREISRRMKKLSARTRAATGREPTLEEFSAMTGKSRTVVRRTMDGDAALYVASLDAPVGNGSSEHSTHLDLLQSPFPDAEAVLLERERAEMARGLLRSLDARSAGILRERFGDDSRTLDEVGCGLGITRERVRQIQVLAMMALRERASRAEKRSTRQREKRSP